MRVILDARGLWEAVEGDVDEPVERQADKLAKEAICRAVPQEMIAAVAVKQTAREAWDVVKTAHIGSERMRKAQATRLRQDFDDIKFRQNEEVSDFAMRLQTLAHQLELLGDPTPKEKVAAKFLRVMPKRYNPLVVAIETSVDLDQLTVEEIVGRAKASEDRLDPAPQETDGGKLLLTEEQWVARLRERETGDGSSGSSRPRRGKQRSRKWSSDGGKQENRSATRANDKCRSCGKLGHWARDCKKGKQAAANVVQVEEDEPTLLMARAVEEITAPDAPPGRHEPVQLSEGKVLVQLDGTGSGDDALWHLDTGATNHMSGSRAVFSEIDENVHGTVRFGDGSIVGIEGRGTVLLTCKTGEHQRLTGVYWIPRLNTNLISIGQLDEEGYNIQVQGGVMTIRDTQKRLVARVQRSTGRLYSLHLNIARPVCLSTRATAEAWRWHERFGHINFQALQRLSGGNMVQGLPHIDRIDQLCESCLAGKQRRSSFPTKARWRAEVPLELVHGDICGPITPATPGGKRYFLLLVDDASRYMWIRLLASKDQAAEEIKKFKAVAEVESGQHLKVLRTDRGGEFTSKNFSDFCAEEGVQRHLTAPYSPQQNGVVERRNQTVVGMARSMLKAKGLRSEYWGEAVTTAVFILNRSTTRSLKDKTPFEGWFGRRPSVGFMRTFGCIAHVKNVKPQLQKLEDRSTPMIFIGYEEGSKAYRVHNPVDGRVRVTRDVVFDESARWNWDSGEPEKTASQEKMVWNSFDVEHFVLGGGTETRSMVEDSDYTSPEDHDPPPATPPAAPNSPGVEFVSPPSREYGLDAGQGGAPLRYRTMSNILDHGEVLFTSVEEPTSTQEALSQICWKRAMEDEMRSILENDTWELEDLPAGHKPIGLKWVFKVKRDEHGTIVKHKARLVAKGYVQRPGIDFDEVFAPVARMESVRLLLAVAAHEGWSVHHMDVKSAFLNGDLQEVVFVRQPEGFVEIGAEHKVLRLRKALYGLRQAPRAWNTKLDSSLVQLGFRKSAVEHGIYVRGSDSSRLIVGVYVDDLVITGGSGIEKLKAEMKKLYRMTDLGLLSYYLGLEVKQSKGEITLCQAAYAAKIVDKGGLLGCNPCAIPMEARLKLCKEGAGALVDATRYRSLVGGLRYLVNSRPDLAFAVGMVSRFFEQPQEEHLLAVKRILRYVAGTLDYGIMYRKGKADGPQLFGYTDSDHAGDINDRKSTSGILFCVGAGPVSWQSNKQKVVALSSCEAEYIAAAQGACQGIWLARLLSDLTGKEVSTPVINVDNKSAIDLSRNPVHHDRSKHIDTKFHYIRDCVEGGKIELNQVPTDDQLADILTKSLGRVKFLELRDRIGIMRIKGRQQD